MEYLEYLKALSSGDPLQQISSIPRIVCVIKEQPSSILVNTIAITMSVEFTQASNRVRYFIADFFSQCATEMCMLRNKQEFFHHLMSVLDLNNPIAQCLMLKIVGHLAPLLSDMIEVHHKVLLALEGTHRQVKEAAYSILPTLIFYCPSMARHVFDKSIPDHYVMKICRVLPDDQETIKRAYSYIVRNFHDSRNMELLLSLACRSRSFALHAKGIFVKHNELTKLSRICKKFGHHILNDRERDILKQYEEMPQSERNLSVCELLQLNRLEGKRYAEKHYKYIYSHWKAGDKYVWVVKRLKFPEERNFCYKLIYKLRIPASYLSEIKDYSLQLALCLIRSEWRGSTYEIIFSLNPWEQYKCACEMMTQGLHTEALQVFLQIKDNFSGTNEKSYEWLCALITICAFETSKAGGVAALSHLGCLDLSQNIYFQSELFLSRLLLISTCNEILSGKICIEKLYNLRSKFDNLLYLFETPQKLTVNILKKWRDLVGMLALCISCMQENRDFLPELQRFYKNATEITEDMWRFKTPQALCRYITNIPMEYPKQFFAFGKPIGLDLQCASDMHLKVSRNSEFVLEFSAKVKEISHAPPLVRFSLKCCNGLMKEEFKLHRDKRTSAAGISSVVIPLSLSSLGVFSLQVKSSVLNKLGKEIGKPEFAEITIECI